MSFIRLELLQECSMIEIEPFAEQTAGGLIENEKRGKGDARPIAAGRNAQIVARMHGGDNTCTQAHRIP
jgi:hypothetical protein